MTKQNPDKLCKSCEEFDYAMNRQNGISIDVLIACDHEEEIEERAMDKRVLTLVVELENTEDTSWIWDCHMNGSINGIWIRAIGEGDQMCIHEVEEE